MILKKKPWTYHARISLDADSKTSAIARVKREYGERYKYHATKWYPYEEDKSLRIYY